MLTQDQIDQAVKDALPDVLAGLRREITEHALYNAKNAAQQAINGAITEWVTREIVPAVHATLAENKDGLVAIVPTIATQLIEQLGEAVKLSLTKKLESSWERKKLFEHLFG